MSKLIRSKFLPDIASKMRNPSLQPYSLGSPAKSTKLRFNPLFLGPGDKNGFKWNSPIKSSCGDDTSFSSPGLLNKMMPQVPIFSQSRRFYEASSDWKNLTGSEHVTLLTANNIEYYIQSSESLLLMFYAPWCHHCKVAKSEFAKAALLINNQSTNATLAAIDCILYPSIADKYRVTGYPTINYYRSGRLVGEYHHRRKDTEFLHFMLREPTSKEQL